MRPRCCLRCLTRFGISMSSPASRAALSRAPRRALLAARPAWTLGLFPRLASSGLRRWQRDPFQLARVGDESPRRRRTAAGPGQRAGTGPGGLLLARRDLVAVVDPDLHADDPERGLRLGRPVVDLGPQRVEGDPPL